MMNRLAVLSLLAALAWAPAASSEVAVYASESGASVSLSDGTSTLDLYIASGSQPSTAGTPCVDGNGEELCAWNIRVQGKQSVSIESFTPEAPGKTIWNLEENTLRANGGDSEQGRIDAEKIGTLQISVTGPGTIELVGDGASVGVGADLAVEQIPSTVIALPEPGLHLGLLLGSVCLLGLSRRRAHP